RMHHCAQGRLGKSRRCRSRKAGGTGGSKNGVSEHVHFFTSIVVSKPQKFRARDLAGIDIVVPKGLLLAGQTETAQPYSNIHLGPLIKVTAPAPAKWNLDQNSPLRS